MRTRASVCTRKRRYTCALDAHAAAVRATVILRPYRCDRCRQFHLTGRTKGKGWPVAPRGESAVPDPGS